MNGEKVQNVEQLKILGVIFDKSHRFSAHHSETLRKLKRRNYALSQLATTQWGASQGSTRCLYRGYIESRVSYGLATTFQSGRRNQLKAIGRELNKSMRIITGLNKSTKTPLLYEAAGLDDLENIWKKSTILLLDRALRVQNSDFNKYCSQKPQQGHSQIMKTAMRLAEEANGGGKREELPANKGNQVIKTHLSRVFVDLCTKECEEDVKKFRAENGAEIEIWSDGSAADSGGASAHLVLSNDQVLEKWGEKRDGKACSYIAEMKAICTAARNTEKSIPN